MDNILFKFSLLNGAIIYIPILVYENEMEEIQMNQSITQVYFSATNNTKKYLKAMAEALTSETTTVFDLTSASRKREPMSFDANDLVLIGMPVYGGRCPSLAMQRLELIKGNDTPCIIIVTYGNRDYDDALLELSDWAIAHGFIVKGAAAVIGKHTFGEIEVERPNEDDLLAIQEFASKAYQNTNKTIAINGNRPYKEGGGGASFRPATTYKCVHCGLCVRQCSTGAIGSDCEKISDQCISCFRCINVCPHGAKVMDDSNYRTFAADFTKRLSVHRENEYFL